MKRNMFNGKSLSRNEMRKVSGGNGSSCGSCRISGHSYGCVPDMHGTCKCSGNPTLSCGVGGGDIPGPIGLGDTFN